MITAFEAVSFYRQWVSGSMRTLTLASCITVALASCGQDEKATDGITTADPLTTIANLGEFSAPELQEMLSTGELSSVTLTQYSLQKIAEIDRTGPTLRSVIAINPDALDQAKASDDRRANGKSLGPLDGIPVLIKDNIETADPMATTAGSTALLGNITGRDNPAIANLRASGAVILGKTNLSQWANFRSNDSISGWSSVGGQVKNAHVLDRSPCGSSSGSAVAVAARIAPLAIGTETNGSIICPSNVNGIVGFKPTVGLVSGDFIVPISPSQDTAGPMAKTVAGAALLLDALTGRSGENSFAAGLEDNGLVGKRVAVASFSVNNNPHINRLLSGAVDQLKSLGAEIVYLDAYEPSLPDAAGLSLPLLEWEFNASLNEYLRNSPADIPTRSLAELIAWNEANKGEELPLFNQDIFYAADQRTGVDDPEYLRVRDLVKRNAGELGIDRLLEESGADLIVAPSGPIASAIDVINGDVWPSWVGIGGMAARAGYPHLTVPMGTALSIPLGLSFIGTAGDDAAVLSAGHAFQQLAGPIPVARFLPTAAEDPAIKQVIEGVNRIID